MSRKLEAEIVALVARERKLTPELRALIREAEKTNLYQERGFASFNDWLASLLRLPRP